MFCFEGFILFPEPIDRHYGEPQGSKSFKFGYEEPNVDLLINHFKYAV